MSDVINQASAPAQDAQVQAQTQQMTQNEGQTQNKGNQSTEPKKAQSGEVSKAENALNETEMAAVQKFMRSWNVPKGVEPVVDKAGNFGFLVKINGEQYIVNPEQLIKGFGLNQAGYQKLEEAKKIQKDLESTFGKAAQLWKQSKDPRYLFQELERRTGIPAEEAAARFLEEKTKEYSMSQEERDAREHQRQIEAERAENERERQAIAAEKYQMRLEQHRVAYENDLLDAMQKHGYNNLKNISNGEKAEIMRKTIEIMANHKAVGQDIKAYDAMTLAKQDFNRSFNRMLSQYDASTIAKLLPDDVKEFIRKESISKAGLDGIPPTDTGIDFGKKIDLVKYPNAPQKQKQKIKLSEW